MNRTEFIIDCWNYYLHLEKDFIKLTRYIAIHKDNYKTFSDEVHKQLLSVAMEFENLNKKISKELQVTLPEKCSINDFTNWLFKDENLSKNIVINVLYSKENIELTPFKKERYKYRNKDGKEIEKEQMPWWRAYNAIKHDRYTSYSEVNFEHLLNALAALNYCEMYLVKEIGDKTDEIDVPNEYSELFEIENWITKDSVIKKGMSFARIEEIDEMFKR